MIDIANDNLDNELNIEKNKNKYIAGYNPYDFYDEIQKVKVTILKNKEFINLEEFNKTNREKFMNNTNMYNPKKLEYWRNIFPTKTDDELEEYRVKWSKENPKYLKFNRL